MDLFEYARELNKDKESPLAGRMRPTTLDEVVGQEHIIGKDKLLYRAIKADKISSIIFYGPPGTGKTTLAKVIANTTKGQFCADECNNIWKERYAGSSEKCERITWNVSEEDNSVYR